MALKKDLEDLLALITDPAERDQQRKLFEKHTVLAEGYLHSADYNRNMDRLKTERKDLEQKVEANNAQMDKWQEWYDEELPKVAKTKEENARLAAEKAEWDKQRADLETKVAAAAASAGGNVDPADIQKLVDAEVAKRGYVSKQELENIIAGAVKEKEQQWVGQTLPAAMEFVATLNDLSYNHRQEFGEAFDRKAFSKFVAENKYEDPNKAYESYVSEKRLENVKKSAKEEGIAEGQRLAQASYAAQTVPGTGVMPGAVPGPVELYKAGTFPAQGLENSKPGDYSLARAAAAELRAEGKIAPA